MSTNGITLERRPYTRISADGTREDLPAASEVRTFRTAADAIRWIKGNLSTCNRNHWGWWGLECEILSGWKIDRGDAEYIAAVQGRHARFVSYVTHQHGWDTVPDSRTYWADNSVTEQQRNRFSGATREHYITPPSGDRCF